MPGLVVLFLQTDGLAVLLRLPKAPLAFRRLRAHVGAAYDGPLPPRGRGISVAHGVDSADFETVKARPEGAVDPRRDAGHEVGVVQRALEPRHAYFGRAEGEGRRGLIGEGRGPAREDRVRWRVSDLRRRLSRAGEEPGKGDGAGKQRSGRCRPNPSASLNPLAHALLGSVIALHRNPLGLDSRNEPDCQNGDSIVRRRSAGTPTGLKPRLSL